jgi:hypothetical protein
MIVTQAQRVRSQLVTLKKLEEDEKKRKDIEATHSELRQVTSALRQFNTLYQLTRSRLDSEQTSYITSQARQIDEAVEASHQEFTQQRRQVKALQDVKQQVESLTQQTEASWKLYAEGQLNPQLELLELVRQLPEILAQLNEINSLRERLEEFRQRTPYNDVELTEFDRKLRKLVKHLSDLNLDPAIRDFLGRVLRGEATLDDLSDEILVWCRQGGRAKTFKIAFE